MQQETQGRYVNMISIICESLQALSEIQYQQRCGSVSKKTSAVISGENPGSKVTKAEELGVEILGQREFERLIGDEA